MRTISERLSAKATLQSILLDTGALVFIYLVPSLSHLLGIPLYLIEPMRVMLILSLTHTSKYNAYFLALTMPLFSFMISGHPTLLKMGLMTVELVLNVFLFYLLAKRLKYLFLAVLLSIVISKISYYLIKYMLIQMVLLNTELISTPVTIQLVTALLFSLYSWKFYKDRKK